MSQTDTPQLSEIAKGGPLRTDAERAAAMASMTALLAPCFTVNSESCAVLVVADAEGVHMHSANMPPEEAVMLLETILHYIRTRDARPEGAVLQ